MNEGKETDFFPTTGRKKGHRDFFFLPAVLLSIFILLILPTSSLSLAYFILADHIIIIIIGITITSETVPLTVLDQT